MKYIDYTGQTLDNRYRILKLLGTGGMGAVYLGQHVVVGKKVAVKFLHSEHVSKTDVVKRFYREAQAAAAIEHKNIIDVSDVGLSPKKEPYLVMEYLEGESLAAMLKRTGPISLLAACGIMEPVLSALAAAHEMGIVHRDLKPENIFLAHLPGEPPPTIKLIDFGISKFTSPEHLKMTRTGIFMGTPEYSSPEQIRGERSLDHRSDIYAVGVLLYEMLTGKLPFKDEEGNPMYISVLMDDPIPPKTAYEGFPTEAESLIMKALRKDPTERYSSATAFLGALQRIQDFEDRRVRLSEYSSGITQKSVAGGDLGSVLSDDGGASAAEVLSELARKSTPADWSKTLLEGTKRRAYRRIGVFFSILFAAGLAIGVFLWRSNSIMSSSTPAPSSAIGDAPAVAPSATPESIPASHPALPQEIPSSFDEIRTVHLEIQCVPEEVSVFYNGTRYNSRLLSVPKSTVSSTLKITAPGYKDFRLDVLPDKDQKLVVYLESAQPVTEAKPNRSSSAKAEKKQASSEKAESPVREKPLTPNPEIIRDGKAKLTESFED